MPRSEEAETFFFAVYSAVQEIPHGKVTTYGHIARLIGTHPSARFNNENVPWQRVINAKGAISPRSQPTGARSQADALRAEDVEVTQTAMGEFEVDFDSYGWFPDVLPSEEGEQ
ncbi:Alkyltransferase-like protein 1 [Colletotrichum sp. SAR11_239]|nr:Alkyltransferase-like protein 1 [Colletotrichum sp. SAR11_239]